MATTEPMSVSALTSARRGRPIGVGFASATALSAKSTRRPSKISSVCDAAVSAINAGGGRGYKKEDVMNEWSNAKLCDVANLVLGGILLVAPWIFGFPSGAASQNAVVSGIVIAVISIAALAVFAVWEEWLNLIVGVWVLISPWVLSFAGSTAMQVHVVIGVIVAALAALEIWLRYQRPPRHTAAS